MIAAFIVPPEDKKGGENMKDIWAYNPDVCDGEEWRPVAGYEDLYEVSNRGRVRRKEWRIVKPRNHGGEYQRVNLCKDGERKQIFVHRLVAEAFIPNPNGYPIINHKDERPKNNRVENLEWCTFEHNANWGTRNERVSKNSANKAPVIAIDVKTGEKEYFDSIRSAGLAVAGKDVGGSSISEAASGIRKSAYGRFWRYAKEDEP